MTREEAIQILSTRDAHGVMCGYTSGVTEALDMAIEALDKQQGEWVDEDSDRVEIDDNGITEGSCWCSVCGEWIVSSDEFPKKGNYFPNCGSYMYR